MIYSAFAVDHDAFAGLVPHAKAVDGGRLRAKSREDILQDLSKLADYLERLPAPIGLRTSSQELRTHPRTIEDRTRLEAWARAILWELVSSRVSMDHRNRLGPEARLRRGHFDDLVEIVHEATRDPRLIPKDGSFLFRLSAGHWAYYDYIPPLRVANLPLRQNLVDAEVARRLGANPERAGALAAAVEPFWERVLPVLRFAHEHGLGVVSRVDNTDWNPE